MGNGKNKTLLKDQYRHAGSRGCCWYEAMRMTGRLLSYLRA